MAEVECLSLTRLDAVTIEDARAQMEDLAGQVRGEEHRLENYDSIRGLQKRHDALAEYLGSIATARTKKILGFIGRSRTPENMTDAEALFFETMTAAESSLRASWGLRE